MKPLLFVLALLVAACSPSVSLPGEAGPVVEAGSETLTPDGSVQGEIVSIDPDPLMVDGDAIIMVRTDDGETVRVLIAARVNLCRATGLEIFGDLAPGDRIEVHGEALEDGVRPCESEEHYLRRLDG